MNYDVVLDPCLFVSRAWRGFAGRPPGKPTTMYLAVTVIPAMLLGFGFVLQQHAAEQLSARYFLRPRLVRELLHKPLWLTGIAAMVVGDLMSAWALGHLSLSVIEPLLTTNLIFALMLAVPISGEVP